MIIPLYRGCLAKQNEKPFKSAEIKFSKYHTGRVVATIHGVYKSIVTFAKMFPYLLPRISSENFAKRTLERSNCAGIPNRNRRLFVLHWLR